MAARTIDGPKGQNVTTAVAAEWLGIDGKTLRRLAADTDWMRPVKIGRATRWHWFDVVVLAHILRCREDGAKKIP